MKILLLGAGGRLGRELLPALAPLGEIVATVSPGKQGNFSAAPGLAWREADLAASDELAALVADMRPDLIVNAAAYTVVEAAEREPLVAQAINGTAPGVLAQAACRCGAALMHYSTDYVFDGTAQWPWREDDATRPLNVYGRSKLAGEEAIRGSDAAHLIVRASWLYTTAGASFATKMLELATQQREIEMVDDQIGAPTSARFVAEATATILSQAHGDPAALFRERGGVVHVACAGETNWCAFAQEIFAQARQLGWPVETPTVRPIRSAERPHAMARPLNSRLDTSRLVERFGIVPPAWEVEFRNHFPQLLAEFMRSTSGGILAEKLRDSP